MPLVTRQAMYA